jgi:hypothetical protein
MKIHLFLLGLVVALFLGCGQAVDPGEQLSDEMIIDFSIREAMGEGNVFDRHMDMRRFGHDHAEAKMEEEATAEERKDGGDEGRSVDATVDPVAQLTGLTIWNRGLGDVSGLLRLKAVKSLYLVDNEIRNVRALAQLANLEELYLDGNPVFDVSALAGCKKLKVLSLRETPAANGPGLAKLRAALPECEIILN